MKTKSPWVSWRLASALLALPLLGMTVPAFAAAPSVTQPVGTNTASENLHNQQAEATQAQINSILQEMAAERIALAQDSTATADASSEATSTITSELVNQQAQLANLGVTPLSSSQVQQLAEEPTSSGTSPQVSTPPSTSDVSWLSGTTTVYYDGSDYSVQTVYAEGLNANSNLWQEADGIPMYSNAELVEADVTNFLQMAVEYAASFVPFLSWVPTAFIPSLSSGLFSVDDSLGYHGQETVSFSFVNPVGEPQYQQLCFVSNWDNFDFTQLIEGSQNGQGFDKTPSEDEVLVAPQFNNSLTEATAEYVDPQANPRYSWVESTKINSYENDGSYTVNFNLPIGMGLVY